MTFTISNDRIFTADQARANKETADILYYKKLDNEAKNYIEKTFQNIETQSLQGEERLDSIIPEGFQFDDPVAYQYLDGIMKVFQEYGYKTELKKVQDRNGTNERPYRIMISWKKED